MKRRGTILQSIGAWSTQKYIPHIGPGRVGRASEIDCGCTSCKGGACCGGHAVQGLHGSSAYHVGQSGRDGAKDSKLVKACSCSAAHAKQ